MMFNFASAAVLSIALLPVPGRSQAAAEQIQKAIYAQQTAGDLDAAIRLYRQVLGSAPDRKLAARAQLGLAQSLLQKGDLAGAAVEFQVLANYSEYKELVASLAGKLPNPSAAPIVNFSNGASGSVIRHGTYTTDTGRGGVYLHKASGVQLTIQPGWTILDTDPEFVTVLIGGTSGSIRVIFNPEPNLALTLAAQFKTSATMDGSSRTLKMGCPTASDQPVPALGWARSVAMANVFFIGQSSVADYREFQNGFMRLLNSTMVP
jgi:hypothetical protein